MKRHLTMALTLALGCSAADHPAARPPTPVRVGVASRESRQSATRYAANVEPATRVDVAFRVGGYVESLGEIGDGGKRRTLDVGDRVTKGQVLARLRPSDYVQRLATARAQQAQAAAQSTLALQEHQRTQRLVASKSIPAAELDSRQAQLDAARAQVDGARAQTREAATALEDTILRAPMDGVILRRSIERGALISPGAPVYVLADTSSVKVVFGVPESVATGLTVGNPVILRGGPLPSARDAKVTRVAPAADSTARVFAIEARIENPGEQLKTGMILSVELPRRGDDPLVIPLSAIVRSPTDGRGFTAFVIEGDEDGGTARQRSVDCGEVVAAGVVVRGGIQAGERVVIAGASRLRDGDLATVIR